MPPSASGLVLEPASGLARAGLVLISVASPAVVFCALFALLDGSTRSAAAIASRPTLAIPVGIGLCALAVAAAWGIHRLLSRQRLTLDPTGLEVVTTFYRRRLALHELGIDRARVVDLDEHTSLKPLFKTNGAAMPGYQSGWFRLRNGRKALVARAGGTRVVWIPTTRNFDLLLQPVHPQSLLDRLRELAAPSASR